MSAAGEGTLLSRHFHPPLGDGNMRHTYKICHGVAGWAARSSRESNHQLGVPRRGTQHSWVSSHLPDLPTRLLQLCRVWGGYNQPQTPLPFDNEVTSQQQPQQCHSPSMCHLPGRGDTGVLPDPSEHPQPAQGGGMQSPQAEPAPCTAWPPLPQAGSGWQGVQGCARATAAPPSPVWCPSDQALAPGCHGPPGPQGVIPIGTPSLCPQVPNAAPRKAQHWGVKTPGAWRGQGGGLARREPVGTRRILPPQPGCLGGGPAPGAPLLHPLEGGWRECHGPCPWHAPAQEPAGPWFAGRALHRGYNVDS